MAKTLAVRLEATILDELNVQATASVYALVDPSALFSDVLSSLNTWLADLDACTDGQIISTELEVLPALPGGLKSAPVTGSRVEQTGVLDFTSTGDTHAWGFAIPAISNSATVISGGHIVITSGQPVNTLFSLLVGGGTAVLEWTNATSQALAAFANCFLSIRQYRKQLARATFET
jgi:hypothetical protein